MSGRAQAQHGGLPKEHALSVAVFDLLLLNLTNLNLIILIERRLTCASVFVGRCSVSLERWLSFGRNLISSTCMLIVSSESYDLPLRCELVIILLVWVTFFSIQTLEPRGFLVQSFALSRGL